MNFRHYLHQYIELPFNLLHVVPLLISMLIVQGKLVSPLLALLDSLQAFLLSFTHLSLPQQLIHVILLLNFNFQLLNSTTPHLQLPTFLPFSQLLPTTVPVQLPSQLPPIVSALLCFDLAPSKIALGQGVVVLRNLASTLLSYFSRLPSCSFPS